MTGPRSPERAATAAIWQELEFGSHRADLPLWEELAATGDGPVLELGAGSGRVALHLAEAGHAVIAVERDAELADELDRRAPELPVTVIRADVAELGAANVPSPVGSGIAPLHLVQQLDPDARRSALAAVAELLGPGGRFGAVVVDESSFVSSDLEPTPLPDMREIEGWVYSSEPLWVQVDERAIHVRRLRERVDPDGEIERGVHDDVLSRLTPGALEDEAEEHGLRPAERRILRTAPAEADSIAVILERA
jgi:SAM-dependent methyltransferase